MARKIYVQPSFFPFFLINCLCLLLLSSSPSSTANNILINCGGPTVSVPYTWIFLGDATNSDSFSVKGGGESIQNDSVLPPDTSVLYQTARIFNQRSYFELNITNNGIYLVRLHFFPIQSKKIDFSKALFNVLSSNLLLLSNFTTKNLSHLPISKEFFLSINESKFRIHFIPANENSVAFINAIEVLLLPEDFMLINNNSLTVPPVLPFNGTTNFLNDIALNTLYRMNIGGPKVNEADDYFRRKWSVDEEPYLIAGVSARNVSYNGKLNSFRGFNSTQDIAPDIVYKTCREETIVSNSITWRFDVKKKAMFLVRLHFCDIVSQFPGAFFNLHIYKNYRDVIDPQKNFGSTMNNFGSTTLQAPFFSDYVVESDDSGYVNISIAINSTSERKAAYLNGLEIMEFVTEKVMEPSPITDIDHHRSKSKVLLIGFVIGGVGLLLILMILVLFALKQRRRRRRRRGEKNEVLFKKVENEIPIGKAGPSSWIVAIGRNPSSPLPKLNLKLKMCLPEILAATENFDTKLLIGEGGFGKVYKGTLSDGMKVAVKRSDPSNGQGLTEFQTEVMVLSKIRGRHLVSLIGYCDEGEEMILVYEFMEKGTLRNHLYSWKENSSTANFTPQVLTWKQRLEICIGAAKGLHYLHTGLDSEIVHSDVKSTNILLDEHLVAKVADFGLSQAGPPDPEHCRMGVIGSFGYLDPEYLITLQLTAKSDVYSFGVVLLEVLCARPPIIESTSNLADWGMLWLDKEEIEKIVDPALGDQINPNSLRRFGEIVKKCLKKEGANRPTMLDVCWDLEYALQLQQTAVHGEPHEDSTTDISSNYIFPESSNSFLNQEEWLATGDGDDDSKLGFSVTMVDGSR